MIEPTYGSDRPQALIQLLRQLAARIESLADRELLEAAPDLQKTLGDIRRELFLYEVRATFDTPEVAESRRIVEQAKRKDGLPFDIDPPDWLNE